MRLELEQHVAADAQLILLVVVWPEVRVGGVIVADFRTNLDPLGWVVIQADGPFVIIGVLAVAEAAGVTEAVLVVVPFETSGEIPPAIEMQADVGVNVVSILIVARAGAGPKTGAFDQTICESIIW